MTTQRDEALRLAEEGFVVFPIAPGTKIPLIKWKTESTCDVRDVDSWWSEFPDDNIGINCAESGLFVVDLDSDEAIYEFDQLWGEHVNGPHSSLPIHHVRTRRGAHCYFENTAKPLTNTAAKLGTGIDTRGHGGMVVGPGSIRDGQEYKRLRSLDWLPSVPEWLDKLVRVERKRPDFKELQRRRKMRWPLVAQAELKRSCAKIVNAPDGEQNKRIYQASFYLAKEACPPLEPEELEVELLLAAERGNHPRDRAATTIRSGIQSGLEAASEELSD